jgi:ATP-dependent DNA helicase DinG
MTAASRSAPRLPKAPALIAGVRSAAWVSTDGAIETIALDQAAKRLAAGGIPLVCHARATARRLNVPIFPALDLLELFAFTRPARFALPTPRGLAQALGMPLPATLEDAALVLYKMASALLSELHDPGGEAKASARAIAEPMTRSGWPWGDVVLAALGADASPARSASDGLNVWHRLREWRESGSLPPPPGHHPVGTGEARERLKALLGPDAENRPGQVDYTEVATAAFVPRDTIGEPRLVLAEAGTGVGKTVGYIAPASLWAEKNQDTVWISTFTRNLQRQLDAELDRLYPDPVAKAEHVVVRKGRENYFCLLNFEEAVGRLATRGGRGGDAVALGLMARWALATRDGDMVGGDFPAWLVGLLGPAATVELTDTRGECIYAACPHYGKCFIEHSARRARHARIVVANHALVLVQAALGGLEGDAARLPTRYVFDEGHHLFDAADSAFSAHLSGQETADLRRWLVGAEEGTRSRARGLKARIEDLVAGNEEAINALQEILRAARILPAPGWRQRLALDNPAGPAEAFLARVRRQVFARDPDAESDYDLEAETQPPIEGLVEAARELTIALERLRQPAHVLIRSLIALLDVEADTLEPNQRVRIETLSRSLARRCVLPTEAWTSMLAALSEEPPPEFVDWFSVERDQGRDADVGLHRHWIDPMAPFARTLAGGAHGILVTSATLRDPTGEDGDDGGWAAAEARTGAGHLPVRPIEAALPSPFDYAARTRVLVVTDVKRGKPDQVAAAYRELFLAADGGGLGLFTAIARLRQVHERIVGPLDEAGIALFAQHVDAMDTGTLVDIFRAEENSCLLGTDAVRDGVDVPGRSLRLIVFDRVPWPRPDILHKARRERFGGKTYDEMLTRLRLKQAYGRLIRRQDDKGVFVMLDAALPSRLATAFPKDVAVERIGLKEAIAVTRAFLATPA